MRAPASAKRHRPNSRSAPVLVYLAGYFLFGAGYIAYMTFMIAYVRDAGGGAAAQSAFWCLIGASAFVTPWVWRRVLAQNSGGISTAIILAVNAIGAALPLFGHSAALLTLSALVFGVSFFAVVGSTTAFVALQLSARGLAHRDRSADDRLRRRPDARTDRHRRDHRRARQPVLCPQCRRGDAGGRRHRIRVSEEAFLIPRRGIMTLRPSFSFR